MSHGCWTIRHGPLCFKCHAGSWAACVQMFIYSFSMGFKFIQFSLLVLLCKQTLYNVKDSKVFEWKRRWAFRCKVCWRRSPVAVPAEVLLITLMMASLYLGVLALYHFLFFEFSGVCWELVCCVPCNLIMFFDLGGDTRAELSREQLWPLRPRWLGASVFPLHSMAR